MLPQLPSRRLFDLTLTLSADVLPNLREEVFEQWKEAITQDPEGLLRTDILWRDRLFANSKDKDCTDYLSYPLLMVFTLWPKVHLPQALLALQEMGQVGPSPAFPKPYTETDLAMLCKKLNIEVQSGVRDWRIACLNWLESAYRFDTTSKVMGIFDVLTCRPDLFKKAGEDNFEIEKQLVSIALEYNMPLNGLLMPAFISCKFVYPNQQIETLPPLIQVLKETIETAHHKKEYAELLQNLLVKMATGNNYWNEKLMEEYEYAKLDASIPETDKIKSGLRI